MVPLELKAGLQFEEYNWQEYFRIQKLTTFFGVSSGLGPN